MARSKKHDEVIARILVELHEEQGAYQEQYKKYYGKSDPDARNMNNLLVSLCERIRKEINNEKR